MKKTWKEVKGFIYFNGFYVGIALIVSPIAYDIIWVGARDALVWSVGVTGMAVQIVGLILMMMGGRDSK